MVFSEVKDKLGGNVRLILTGSAPISSHVMDFLRICFSCPVIEGILLICENWLIFFFAYHSLGYGQTESCAAICSTHPHSTTSGHVGFPLAMTEIKLVDIPALKYLTTDKPHSRGELCYRGPNCTPGYYGANGKENTEELIDKDGWYHSGDICEIQNDKRFAPSLILHLEFI